MEFNSDDFDDLGFDEPVITLPNNDDPPPADPPQDDLPTTEPDEVAVSYYEFLKENSILDVPEDFEFDGTAVRIQEALELTKTQAKQKARQELLNELHPELKPLLEYGLEGGRSLQNYLQAYQEPNYDLYDLDDVDHQRALLFEYYRQTSNYAPEKINKIIDRLTPEDLESEAIETVQELKDLAAERRANLLEQAKLEKAAKETEIKQQTDKLTSLIEQSKAFDENRKNRLKTFMFVPVSNGQTKTTQLATTMSQVTNNPEHLIQLADILADYNPNTGFSFERVKKQLKTETNQTFKEYLHSKVDPKSQMKGGVQQKPENDVDWDQYFNYK